MNTEIACLILLALICIPATVLSIRVGRWCEQRIDRLFDKLEVWLQADTQRTRTINDNTWRRTDMGMRGVTRNSVAFWSRIAQVFNAARKGRYNDDA